MTHSPPYREEQILFEMGSWSLRVHNTTLTLLQSYIQHQCPIAKTRLYWYSLKRINEACRRCSEYPPDDIMGLWKLHNMDYIQTGKSH